MAHRNSKGDPQHVKDGRRTPPALYAWLDGIFSFDYDLACTRENCLAPRGFFWPEFDSLKTSWWLHTGPGFCNPPYGDPDPWVEKAVLEGRRGATSVLLLPCPNGEIRSEMVLNNAHITWIIGRISFIHAVTGLPETGNTSGSIIAVFGSMTEAQKKALPITIRREEILK